MGTLMILDHREGEVLFRFGTFHKADFTVIEVDRGLMERSWDSIARIIFLVEHFWALLYVIQKRLQS